VARGDRPDLSGDALTSGLDERGHRVVARDVVPDETERISGRLLAWCDGPDAPDLVVTTGGTGLGPRDVTPEATAAVVQRTVPGIAEALRALGARSTTASYLSRGIAGVRGRTLIVNVPGSPGAARDAVPFLAEIAPHAQHVLAGGGHEPVQGEAARRPEGLRP